MTYKITQSEVSALGQALARCHFALVGTESFPIDPEIIASKYFGLDIVPQRQLMSVGVRSGIDTSQSVIFIDYDIYMSESAQHLARQGIAHELGHVIFDGPLLRRLSATTVDDAFAMHEIIVKKNSGIEWTAHQLSGAFLVPRDVMLRQVATMLYRRYDLVTEAYPHLTLEQIFQQMAASQLTRYFGVSEDVIRWRFTDEQLHREFDAMPQTALAAVDKRLIGEVSGMQFTPQPLSERIRALLPEDLSTFMRQQVY